MDKYLTNAAIVVAFVLGTTLLGSMTAGIMLHTLKEWRIYQGDGPCLVYK
jgi:hypothetical protein